MSNSKLLTNANFELATYVRENYYERTESYYLVGYPKRLYYRLKTAVAIVPIAVFLIALFSYLNWFPAVEYILGGFAFLVISSLAVAFLSAAPYGFLDRYKIFELPKDEADLLRFKDSLLKDPEWKEAALKALNQKSYLNKVSDPNVVYSN